MDSAQLKIPSSILPILHTYEAFGVNCTWHPEHHTSEQYMVLALQEDLSSLVWKTDINMNY